MFYPIEKNLRAHDRVLLQALQEVSETPDGRLMVFMPRGAAKSTYSAIVFPSWFIGNHPDKELIIASYGEGLPRDHGARVKSIVRQTRYQHIFGCELSRDSQAKDDFRLSNGSRYYATGIGAAVVGHRAQGIIFDDPVKGFAEARSQVVRDSTYNSYAYDLRPTLLPRGFIVIVMTRWDEDDIAGRNLPENWNGESGWFTGRLDGLKWRVLCVQARCETNTDPIGRKIGEYLAPEWFPRSTWDEYERTPMLWASMCQQLPRPAEGSYFKVDSFLVGGQPVEWPLPGLHARCDLIFVVIDTAMKTGKTHDGTAATFFAYSKHQQLPVPLYVLDWDIVQIEGGLLEHWMPKIFERGQELANECGALYGFLGAWIEDKQSGTILLQQATNKGWPATPIDTALTAMGKNERAFNAQSYVAAGSVKITAHAYHKVVEYKGSRKNHWLSQVMGFAMDSKDSTADDLLDTLTYGVAISVGNQEGF